MSDVPVAPLQGSPKSEASDPQDNYIEEMLLARAAVCHEHTITTSHNQCIGCVLVLEFMHKHHPKLTYGTADQWEIESAFCLTHERDIIKDFIARKGAVGGFIPKK